MPPDYCYYDCFESCQDSCLEQWFQYDYEDYECQYSDVSLQESSNCTSIYSGDLLISEVLFQDLRMYVLASNYMLIADIDCGNNCEPYLNKLARFVDKNGGSFRVYKTLHGMRYLQTDLMYQGANKSAIATLKELGSDRSYIKLCAQGKRFMARLTPKIAPELATKYFTDRQNGSPSPMAVCHFLKTVGNGECLNSLRNSLYLHDAYTQSNKLELQLA